MCQEPPPRGLSITNELEALETLETRRAEHSYQAFCDMSGGSADDATLAIAHLDADGVGVLDRVFDQGQRPPFDPLSPAVSADILHFFARVVVLTCPDRFTVAAQQRREETGMQR